MKRNILTAALFILVILCVAGGVYLKWVKSQEAENMVDQGLFIPSFVIGRPGSHTNPVTGLKGETFEHSDETVGITIQLPIEFKEPSIKGEIDSLYFKGNHRVVKDDETGENYNEYTYYRMDFDVLDKNIISNDIQGYSYENIEFPQLKKLKVGESYTYNRYTMDERIELYGENSTIGNHTYTRLPSVNGWWVFQFIADELEPGAGYISTLETENHYINFRYDAGFYFANDKKNFEQFEPYLSNYYAVLESVRGI